MNQNNNKKSTPLDAVIGERIKSKRSSLNITQDELARHLNITFQQVQKYEKGKNRVSASTLYHIAQKLSVPLDYFFEGDNCVYNLCENEPVDGEYIHDSLCCKESIDILKCYYKLNITVRKKILDLIKIL